MGCQLLSACCSLNELLGTETEGSPFESWQSCTVKAGQPVLYIYIFFLLSPHETAQTKYPLYTKSFGDELKLHLDNVHAHYYCSFFFLCRQRRNVWFSFIRTYQNLSWFIGKNCVILRFDIAVVLQTRQASLFISGRQKKLRLPTTQALKLNRVHKVNSLRLFQRSFARCNRNEVCHSLREGIIDTFLLSLSYV